ncbi:hypothetical protein SLS55_000395 [Diplodia seriata]|uniref:Ribosome biogenesis protein SLX9 n=2 Tax=Diplodia seriata TaxID=420778 RepID=A0A0G2EPG8_9PEZI|nr:putative fringe-like protein [Diplodia seriata]
MAPTKGKRASLRAKASKSTTASNVPASDVAVASGPVVDIPFSSFRVTKKDKREMKHSLLMSKVQKSAAPKKKRRPNKQLVTTLESLADALPDAGDDDGAEADGEDGTVEVGQAKIKHKSLKSRPGALKRKQKLERMEQERFEKNLALMSTGASQAPQGKSQDDMDMGNGPSTAPTSNRWSALRNFIESTMEKKKDFVSG